MRVTKERLLNLTQSYLAKHTRQDSSITCVYLTGSMRKEDPFLHGTTDIDLFMIHDQPIAKKRELIPITPEATLDIVHLEQSCFSPSRKVRKDPWIGSSLCFDPIILYNKNYWFEFTQASIEAGFFSPEYVICRSNVFLNEARRLFNWLQTDKNLRESIAVSAYLKVLEYAANALIVLYDAPATERSFPKQFKEIAEKENQMEIVSNLNALLLGEMDPSPYFEYFYTAWHHYFDFFSKSDWSKTKNHLSSSRLLYYTEPVKEFWSSHLLSALWIMTKTWASIADTLMLDKNEYFTNLTTMLQISPAFFPMRLKQADRFLDQIEEHQETWAKSQGIFSESA